MLMDADRINERFSSATVVVVGDVMLDCSIIGDAHRISPEAPVPVVRSAKRVNKLGGAANVAANLAALGVNVILHGVIGEDEAGEQLKKLALDLGIQAKLLCARDFQTIVKTRIVCRGQQLVRVDDENNSEFSSTTFDQEEFIGGVERSLGSAQALILSDYAKGSIESPAPFIECARRRNVPIIIDPKSADFTVYSGASVITPNAMEFARAKEFAGLGKLETSQVALRLLESAQVEAICLTQGERGVSIFQANAEPVRIAAEAREVFDVTGAGDTFAAVLSAGLAIGEALPQAAILANKAAGLVVAKPGTATLTVDEIFSSAAESKIDRAVILDEESLDSWLAEQNRLGHRVVMSNGCFDLLHPGHIDCLRKARELGDVLLLAVNSDESVRKLKGPNRPISVLQDRLSLLQACRYVDALIAFDAPTPLQLIRSVRPSVLVKGGDYDLGGIVGADDVLRAGGQVRSIDLVAGYSTTSIIARIQSQTESKR